MKVGSLFSGIGGLDLGLERAGMTVTWQSEIDPYACKVLAKHWPGVPNHGDIKNIDWRTVEPVDIICGGYPCQPFSTAGKRRGINDPRHLWPWVRDAISALRPRYAILENVRGHLSMGGLTVIGELAEIGYDAEWRVVSAAGLGAPHRRDRIIIIAYPNGGRSQVSAQRQQPSEQLPSRNGRERQVGNVANTEIKQRNGGEFGHRAKEGVAQRPIGIEVRRKRGVMAYADHCGHVYTEVSQQSDIRRRCQESGWEQWEVEPDVGRVADGVPHRVDRLRGLGNAVVPQVAEYIGWLVMAHAQHN